MFRDFTCDFDPGLTVLVADNGGGKTSILDAIRVAFGTYLSTFPTGKGVGITPADVYTYIKNGDLGQINSEFPANIALLADLNDKNHSVLWSRRLGSSKSGTTMRDAKPITDYAKQLQSADSLNYVSKPTVNWPILAYYGTGRLWNLKKLTEDKQFKEVFYGRSAGYTDCMDPASSYKLVLSWFRYAAKGDFSAKMKFVDANPGASALQMQSFRGPFSDLLKALQQATNIVLAPSGWQNISYSETLKDAIVEHDVLGTMPVSQLSDGIRNTVALVADLAYRAVQLNPHLAERAALETDGIVLIDEVDMHLHPSWQQTILASLREAFPKLQFIVTTHSPQVLSTVKRENIRILGKSLSGELIASLPLAMTYGEPSNDVMQSVMFVDPQPPVPEKMDLQRLTSLVDQGDYESGEAKRLTAALNTALGEQHPQLQRLQRSIQRQRILKK